LKVLLIEPRNCWRGLNIALGYLAAALKKADIEVRVLDLANHRKFPEEVLERRIIEFFKPDLIGIAMFYVSYFPVKKMIKRIKEYCSSPIVVGGPQIMIEKDDLLADIEELDYAIVGDGEDAIVELCKAINGEMGFNEIDGLIYREDGTIKKNRERRLNENIDSISFPDYRPFGVKRIRHYTIITSRGCSYSCSYCFRSTKKWRPRSPENIVEELKKAINDYEIEEFVVTDDAFNIQPQRVIEFCRMLERDNIKVPWYCTGVRADRMTDELARHMKRAGCYSINIGVETLQKSIYAKLNRKMSIQDIDNCLKILRKHKIKCVGYFMIGLPGDSREKTLDTFRKAKKMGIQDTSIAIYLPFPKTEMYAMVYNDPNVRKIADYRTISTIWTFTSEYSVMKTAFETPEYTANEKIEMYNRIRTRQGDPRPPFHDNKLLFAIRCLYWILKYDFQHFPITTVKLVNNVLTRYIRSKGKHIYKFDIQYDTSFINYLNAVIKQTGGVNT